ncbi:MAG: hypothetical protein AAFV33_08420, partial [Chloroflexota bacterium]
PQTIAHYYPFYRFGLHRNPFGTLSEQEWYAVTVPSPPVQAALDTGFDHLMVLGRKGRGKSTVLNYLRYHFAMQGQHVIYERLPPWHWRYTTDLSAGVDVFAFDEMQRLAPWEMVRLFREQVQYGTRLIIGSHRDHRPEFALAGVRVVTIRLGGRMTRDHLAAILQRRLDVFALEDEKAGVWFALEAVDMLFQRYRDDLRTMNTHLYDVLQRLERPGPITADDVR